MVELSGSERFVLLLPLSSVDEVDGDAGVKGVGRLGTGGAGFFLGGGTGAKLAEWLLVSTGNLGDVTGAKLAERLPVSAGVAAPS